MKKYAALDCGPKGCCGKCAPCLAMQKLAEKQQIPSAKCTLKQRNPQATPELELIGSIYTCKNLKRNRVGRGDENSTDSDHETKICPRKYPKNKNELKLSVRGKPALPEEASDISICITRKPGEPLFKKPIKVKHEESEETIYIRKPKIHHHELSEDIYNSNKVKRDESAFGRGPKCAMRGDSFETVYSKSPKCIKREESFDTVYSKQVRSIKRDDSFETIHSKKPKSVKRDESHETIYSKKPKRQESFETGYSQRIDCIKRDKSNETSFSRTIDCVKREKLNETPHSSKPKCVKRKISDQIISASKGKKNNTTDSGGNSKKRAINDIGKTKKSKRQDSEEVVFNSKNKCGLSDLKQKHRDGQTRLQPSPSNTSMPDEGGYIDYIPRMCIQQRPRPRSREIRAGIAYTGCDCGKRNGLQDQCRRTECQGCPKCKQFPPACYLSRFSNARHLTKLKDAAIRKKCPYVDKKGNILIST